MRDMHLALDPGVTTGFAWTYKSTGAGLARPTVGQVSQEELTDALEVWRKDLAVIIIERYTITGETLKKSRQSASLEIIGHTRAIAYLEDIPFVLQSPGDAKRFATDEKLRMAGWMLPKTQDHANDAQRHLMLHLVKARLMEPPR